MLTLMAAAAMSPGFVLSGTRDLLLDGQRFRVAAAPVRELRTIDLGAKRVGLWREGDAARYAITLNQGEVNAQGEARPVVRLRYAEFDPLRFVPPVAEAFRSEAVDSAFIVQFQTRTLPEYAHAIETLGGRVRAYLPDQCFVVSIDPGRLPDLRSLAFVRWVGPYHPAYRLEPPVMSDLRAGALPTEARYVIQAMEPSTHMKSVIATRIELLGGRIDQLIPGGSWLEATLAPEALSEVIGWDEVFWVERWTTSSTDMDIARQIGGAFQLERDFGYAGRGVRGEVMDTNLRVTHVDFRAVPPLIHGSRNGNADHGTSVYGIVFGDGTGNALARGMLPLGQGIFADYDFLNDRYAHTRRLKSSPYFAVFQTNSWGNAQTTDYTSVSAQLDDIIFQNDILILNSQSNTGDRNSRPQAWSKNVVAVGGIAHFGTLTKSDDRWTSASFGPAADGRLKPDLSHFYDNIFTTDASDDSSYTTGFGGTSGATPIVAGHFGLFFEMWADGVFGNTVLASTVFDAAPKFTTAKAFIVNTASPYPFSGRNANLSRYRQGWGLPDVGILHGSRNNAFFVNETDVLEPLQTRRYRLLVTPGTPSLRATMTYADLPGTTSATLHRINKLRLRAVAPDGTFYWGNNGLIDGNASTPSGAPNDVDTLENVFVANPRPGVWTVEVIAAEINRDGRIETPGVVDADFALVVTGVASGFAPSAFAIREGSINAGDLPELATSNNRTVQARAEGGLQDRRVVLDVSAVLPTRDVERIDLRVESRSAEPSRLTIQAQNANGVYENVTAGDVTSSDGVIEGRVLTNRYVGPDGTTRLRLIWTAPPNETALNVQVDQVRWTIEPRRALTRAVD
jgi:hypothetical protein